METVGEIRETDDRGVAEDIFSGIYIESTFPVTSLYIHDDTEHALCCAVKSTAVFCASTLYHIHFFLLSFFK